MKIEYSLFNPAGNITALVSTYVDKQDRMNVAKRIIEAEPSCQQLGFVCVNGDTVMLEMAGGEFCGNATRCAALLTGKKKVICSGYDQYIDAEVNANIVKITLPSVPTGIVHKIFEFAPNKEYENKIREEKVPTGYMFLEGNKLTPLVYVPKTDILFWEDSCASGSMIAALYLAKKAGKDMDFCFDEPGGKLNVSVSLDEKISLWGEISLIKEGKIEL